MEPIHIPGLLPRKVDEQLRLGQLEHYFAVRAETSRRRRERIQRLQRRIGRSAPRPTTRPAV